jgi:hypothetical protein
VGHYGPPVGAFRANWFRQPKARRNQINAPVWGCFSGFPPFPDAK